MQNKVMSAFSEVLKSVTLRPQIFAYFEKLSDNLRKVSHDELTL